MVIKKKVDPTYQKMVEQIKIDEDDFADEEMKPVYAEQKKSLDDLHGIVGMMFIKYAVDGLLKMNAQQKASVGVDETLKNIGKNLGDVEVSKVTDILGKTYSETYYKNAFVMDSGIKTDLKFDILKPEYIDAAVNSKYKEELFSDRIWSNKASMIDKLQSSITDAMKGNTTIDKVGRDIKNTFNVSAYDSQRLVRTENARIQSQAIDDIANSTGVKQQMYSATLDSKTNPEDASFDGNIYDVDDESKPEIPQHPNCRCCYINVPYEGWTPTQRKDNETKDIIDYKDYDAWLKDKGVNISENSNANNGKGDIINNNSYETYKNQLIGLNTPDGITISDLSSHGYDRIIGDDNRKGVGIDSVINAIIDPLDTKPIKIDAKGRKSKRYVGEKAEIAINPDKGNIVSVNPTSTKKAEMLLKRRNENNGNQIK